MTPLRPEPDAGQEGPYAQGAYEGDGMFEAAVDRLADPLSDPLPGQHASPWFRTEGVPAGGGVRQEPSVEAQQASQQPQQPPREWYDPEGYQRDWYGRQGPREPAPQPVPAPREAVIPDPGPPAQVRAPAPPVRNDETVALRTADTRRAERTAEDDESAAGAVAEPPATGGRAERRRAAKGRGRRRGEPVPAAEGSTAKPAVPMSRLEARRAARAAKDSPAVVASRVVGEVFITFGVLMLLFVTYQLWWTNIRADQIAGRETNKIQDEWANGERTPGAFEPGKGFAIMHIPKLDVVAPIAEGISKDKVLDRGMIGHYGEGKLKTAMPSAKQGNFSVAGHRNTHGEPFRYINKLKPGDPIVVETQDAYYTYEMFSILPQTSPSNVSVIGEVPPGSGFTGPGRYITLTTCTPEFTSTYRMIVWGKMVEERPRSKGKPDALVG
ncbi:class E sortase [Streptomyces sp. NPDC001876]|uniref:class E sortase n=1 Tax=Streptomyces sp. NPDC001876 TaxID=3154402 RepID=UPI0033346E35